MALRLALALAVLACVAAAPANAAFPGGNGKIAFSSDRGGQGEIYVMDPDGANQVNLTNTAGIDDAPVWSADGSSIAFNSDRLAAFDLDVYVMGADGSGQSNRTNTAGVDESEPAISPDGALLAFNAGVITSMAIGGGAQDPLSTGTGNDSYPVWSPDGSKIAFMSDRDGDAEIFVMNADGTNETNLTTNSFSDGTPDWSPDGSKIAFSSDRDGNSEIYVMDASGANPVRLTNSSDLANFPAWSPDGTKIAFQSDRSGNYDVWAMNADGTSPTNLTNSTGADIRPDWQRVDPAAAPPSSPSDSPPVSSPDPPAPAPAAQSQAPVPVALRTANAEPVSGTVRVRRPGSAAFVPLATLDQIPMGSEIDATRGVVRITVSDGKGGLETVLISEGRFKITQIRERGRLITLITLTGGSFRACPRLSATAAANRLRKTSSVRHLWVDGKGAFRTKGRYSAATIRGTRWLTDDRCDGTLTRVTQGAVGVRDLVKRKTVVVRARGRYLARARLRRR